MTHIFFNDSLLSCGDGAVGLLQVKIPIFIESNQGLLQTQLETTPKHNGPFWTKKDLENIGHF